jgi:hypothetical protein
MVADLDLCCTFPPVNIILSGPSMEKWVSSNLHKPKDITITPVLVLLP